MVPWFRVPRWELGNLVPRWELGTGPGQKKVGGRAFDSSKKARQNEGRARREKRQAERRRNVVGAQTKCHSDAVIIATAQH